MYRFWQQLHDLERLEQLRFDLKDALERYQTACYQAQTEAAEPMKAYWEIEGKCAAATLRCYMLAIDAWETRAGSMPTVWMDGPR